MIPDMLQRPEQAGNHAVARPKVCGARATDAHSSLLRTIASGLLALAQVLSGAMAGPQDGDWRLRISGHTSYVFGEPGFGGGLRIPWEVVIGFEVRDGDYYLGSGSARWLDQLVPLSHPPNWFSCRQVHGTYLDSNLALHETPRVRFAAFPVAGEVTLGRVRLAPAYRPPGNYLAVTYECTSDNPLAYNWFPVAERGKQILGKRQDVEKHAEGVVQRVRVREVAAIPPEAGIELPLEDGWAFSQGAADDSNLISYRLSRDP